MNIPNLASRHHSVRWLYCSAVSLGALSCKTATASSGTIQHRCFTRMVLPPSTHSQAFVLLCYNILLLISFEEFHEKGYSSELSRCNGGVRVWERVQDPFDL